MVDFDPVILAYVAVIVLPILIFSVKAGKLRMAFMPRSKRLAKYLDGLATNHGSVFNKMSVIGFILGTGVLGLHFLYKKHHKLHKRPGRFFLGFLFVAIVSYLFSVPFFKNEVMLGLSVVLSTFFGLGYIIFVALIDQGWTIVS
ncbi:MAG: hypothetical protein GOV15_01675, partial [Candidatus Diapherotrites archaeon]|nr:hypothetical protein [Candidatus Diapherotrites archaeon]